MKFSEFIKEEDDLAASGAYSLRLREVKIKLARIAAAIDAHAGRQQKDPTNWGYPGDLGHVDEKIDDIVKFLS